MTRSRLSLLTLLALVLAAALPAAAQGSAPDLAILAQQYQQVFAGVWQRSGLDGQVEHLALGPEGLAWALTRLHEQSNRELELYLQKPTAERWERIGDLAKTMEEIRADITNARSIGLREALRSLADRAAACHYTIDLSADAHPLNPGAGASASASWWNDCNQVGCVYCYTSASVNSTSDNESQGGCHAVSVGRSCSAAVSGSGTCSSYAYAYVYVSGLSIFNDVSDSNSSCGTTPLSASLSCNQYPPGGGYPQVDCTGSASGGTPPYHAYWKEGSYAEFEAYGSPGSGPWSKSTICKYLSPGFTPFTLRFRVVDSAGAQLIRNWYCGLAP